MSLMTDIAALIRNKLNEHRGLIDGKAPTVHTHAPDEISGLSGASKYVGTDAAGTPGVHDLPVGGGGIQIGRSGSKYWEILGDPALIQVKHYYEKRIINYSGSSFNGLIHEHGAGEPNGPGIGTVYGVQVTPRIIDSANSKEAICYVKDADTDDAFISFTVYTYNRATTSIQSWTGEIQLYIHIFGI